MKFLLDATGFIRLNALRLKVAAKVQRKKGRISKFEHFAGGYY